MKHQPRRSIPSQKLLQKHHDTLVRFNVSMTFLLMHFHWLGVLFGVDLGKVDFITFGRDMRLSLLFLPTVCRLLAAHGEEHSRVYGPCDGVLDGLKPSVAQGKWTTNCLSSRSPAMDSTLLRVLMKTKIDFYGTLFWI